MVPPSERSLDLEALLAQRPRLAALARRLLADEHGAEDVVQEAWVAALERPPRDERALGAWIREVVRTRALRRKRGERRAREREERVARPEAESVAGRLRTQREVVDAVLALDEPLRATIHARYFEDQAPREIARRQGVSIDTVNDRLKRARRRLRADLERRLGGDDARAWSLALLPLAVSSPVRWTPLLLGELLVMKKTLAVALVVLFAAVTGVFWPRGDRPRPPIAEPGLARSPELPAALERPEPSSALEAEPRATLAPATERAPAPIGGASDWIVRGGVFFGPDTPAPGIEVRAQLWSGYDTDVPAALEETLSSDAQGRIAWPLPTPEETVTLRLTPASVDAVSYADGAVAVLGEGPPQALELHVYPLDITVFGTVRDERGAPVPDALVRGATEDKTDAEGRFRVRGSSHRAQEYVSARAAGLALERASVETPAAGGEVECDFSLRPAFVITGRVVEENGLPVAGARLSTFFGGGESATSDADGLFALEHLDPGHDTHTVIVVAEGFPKLNEAVETGSGEPVEREFILVRGARVAGRVVDARGAGVAAASICMGFSTNAWNALWAKTGDDGRFEFPGAPRGEQTLWIERDGFAAQKHVFEVPELGDHTGDLTIVLDLGRGVAGRVVDAEGRGVPNVRVTPRYEGDLTDNQTKTDAEGRFELAHVPDGELELSFYRPDWDRVMEQLSGGEVSGLTVVMNPSGRVAGRVIDAATGAPIESFRIRLERVPEPAGLPPISLWATWVREGRAFSDADGYWESTDLELPVGRAVGVEVRAEGYATSELVRAQILAEPDADELVIALARGRRVTGRVVDAASGAPVVGARVTCRPAPTEDSGMIRAASWGDAWASEFTRTDAAGEFAFENVAPQRVLFDVEHEDYEQDGSSSAQVPARGPEPIVRIEMGGAGRIRGVALDRDGNPRAGLELLLIGVEVRVAGEPRFRQTTDSDGRFAFDGLPEGYYQLGEALALQSGNAAIERGIGVGLRGVLDVEVAFQPDGEASIRGTLIEADGLEGAVELTFMSLPERSDAFTHPIYRVLARDGSFELLGIRAGRYTIESGWTVDGRSVRGLPIELELTAGEEARPALRLTPR